MFKTFKSFKSISEVFNGLNDWNVLNGLNPIILNYSDRARSTFLGSTAPLTLPRPLTMA